MPEGRDPDATRWRMHWHDQRTRTFGGCICAPPDPPLAGPSRLLPVALCRPFSSAPVGVHGPWDPGPGGALRAGATVLPCQ